jgi:hypothetical protein
MTTTIKISTTGARAALDVRRGYDNAFTIRHNGGDFTGWTFVGVVRDGEAGNDLFALSVIQGAEPVVTVTLDQIVEFLPEPGLGRYWFDLGATGPGEVGLRPFLHGPMTVVG